SARSSLISHCTVLYFFLHCSVYPPLLHSFPTRRSSDLLLQSSGNCFFYRHHFPCCFHLSTKRSISIGQFIKWPSWEFHNFIIEFRLKGCECFFSSCVVHFI